MNSVHQRFQATRHERPLTPPPASPARSNVWVAEHLRQAADLLALQGANPFRVSAYRHAADTIDRLETDLRDIVQPGGQAALDAMPGIGPSIAAAVMEMLTTGRWGFLERLKATAEPETLFRSVPGIGPALAHRIQQTLNLDSLEALETAAHDGRLATAPGFGGRRLAIVRTALANLLGRLTPPVRHHAEEPAVALLLDVDREYRDKAARGVLRKIAPRRFNPGGVAWLPVLHTVRAPWHFTALYSNTAQAHKLVPPRRTSWREPVTGWSSSSHTIPRPKGNARSSPRRTGRHAGSVSCVDVKLNAWRSTRRCHRPNGRKIPLVDTDQRYAGSVVALLRRATRDAGYAAYWPRRRSCSGATGAAPRLRGCAPTCCGKCRSMGCKRKPLIRPGSPVPGQASRHRHSP